MKLLGINISHDTSVATLEDGVITNLYEEERCIRKKYYDPNKELPNGLQCIEQYNLTEGAELVAFSSYDRRDIEYSIDVNKSFDPIFVKRFLQDFTQSPLSIARLDELKEEYSEFNYSLVHKNMDNNLIEDIMEHHFDDKINSQFDSNEHHLYHAFCGAYMARNEFTSAMCIVWDGGGAMKYYDTYPGYQEIESIFEIKDLTPTIKYSRISNLRSQSEFSYKFPNQSSESCGVLEDVTLDIDGVEVCLTSKPSSGMNFSNMSAALGTDDLGRAAGKVMGMASYGVVSEDSFTKYNISQALEVQTFEHSCKIIQKALDMNPDNKNIILSGGYSLNCTNNYKYLERFPDINIFVDPVCHDGGTAIGVALEVSLRYRGLIESTGNYVKRSVWNENN